MTAHDVRLVISFGLALGAIIASGFNRFDIAAYLMAFAVWMEK